MLNPRKFRTILITGISGSGGSYLAEYIVNTYPEVQVHGVARWHSTSNTNNLDAIKNHLHLHECDLLDFSSVLSTLNTIKPDAIFHLAAHANVRAGFIVPLAVINNNIMGTANLLEAIKLSALDPVVQLCSTSEVYGKVDPKHTPITEACPIKPVSPYAVSKTTQDLLGYTYFSNYDMKIIRTRMFAYLNPRRTDLFATSFARQVALIEHGVQSELLHGNLDSVRTLIDVRDAMSAYWVAAQCCEFGEVYNIGGETVISVGDFLEMLKSLAKTKIKSRTDPSLLRPTDVTLQIPDTRKFREQTGWKPQYDFKESLQYLLEYWRKVIARELSNTTI